MKTKELQNINDLQIEESILKKIIEQANFVGLDKNLQTGAKIIVKVESEIYQYNFNREEAIKQHKAPKCGSLEEDDYTFSNKQELTKLLEMEKTISDSAFFKAVNDRTYLHNLLCSKGTPFLEALLNDTKEYPPSKYVNNKKSIESNTPPDKLILRFAKSMIKWGKSGFAKADEATYNRRISACKNCNMLSSVPEKFLYKLITNKHNDIGICASCGCVVSKKALIATDTCPMKHPDKPGLNRWEEPFFE